MATTRIIFNTNEQLKRKAQKRAHAEGTDLTSVLNQAVLMYAEGAFDPDDYLTKEDMLSIRRGLKEAREGRGLTLRETRARLGL